MISQAMLGQGGVGKSELALQYAHHHRQDYELVWWIDAERPDRIRTSAGRPGESGQPCGIDSVAAEPATMEEAAGWVLGWLVTFRTGRYTVERVRQRD
ncbi:GTPase SAR1 family protein [Nonomuraea thailandensis]|uniref:GTPase SAR1 family protein n=1 Tax=Nonomuraea thailandensis TaxID=1188745 RepID=A0A9X2GID1_9ACTN|nr:hypothetical protein [Nonomuraea thailandensis]MCP2358365.1 GTPase SAR1 family protein [Nonomuraea thailandensis]